jgi:hypothetical protein
MAELRCFLEAAYKFSQAKIILRKKITPVQLTSTNLTHLQQIIPGQSCCIIPLEKMA